MKQRLQSRLRLFACDSGFEPAENFGPAEAVVVQSVKVRVRQFVHHRYRNTDLRSVAGFHPIKSGAAHAEDRQRPTIDNEFLPNDGPVSAETRLPVAVAENGNRMPALDQIVGSVENPANGGADPQNREIISGHKLRADQLRAALICRARAAERQRERAEHAAEDLVLVADLPIHWIRNPLGPVVTAIVLAAAREHYYLLGVFHRKRLQNQLIDEGENCRVGANSERERQDGGRQKQRGLAQSADRVSEISQKSGH